MQVILKVDKAKARLGASVFLRYGEIAIDKDGRDEALFSFIKLGNDRLLSSSPPSSYIRAGYRASSFHPGLPVGDLIFDSPNSFQAKQRRFD
jgi:hypothetical protein